MQFSIQDRIAVGALEGVQANIKIADVVAPAQRVVDVLLFVVRLVLGMVCVHHQRRAETAFFAGEGALAEIRQHKHINNSPVTHQRHIDHRLTQLVFAIRCFNAVGLVNHVHQMLELGDAPEHPPDTNTALKAVGYVYPAEIAQIKVVALVVAVQKTLEHFQRDGIVATVPFPQ